MSGYDEGFATAFKECTEAVEVLKVENERLRAVLAPAERVADLFSVFEVPNYLHDPLMALDAAVAAWREAQR